MGVSFDLAVVAHGAASIAALTHLLQDAPTLPSGLLRLLQPATPSGVGLLLLANLGLAGLLCASVLVRRLFLGSLSAYEGQAAAEKALSFALFKALSLAALEENDPLELLLLVAFSAFSCCLRVFLGLARDRFERFSASPAARPRHFARTLALVAFVAVLNSAFALFVLRTFASAGGTTLALLLHDSVFLGLHASILGVRFCAHAYEARLYRDAGAVSGEQRRRNLHCVEFLLEACIDLVCLANSALLFWLSGLSISLVDSILLLHLRSLALELSSRVSRFVAFLLVSRDLRRLYKDVSPAELASHPDVCAICRESLEKAKRLPCGHLLHTGCLARWLEVKTECPVCRRSLTH